MQAVNRRNIPWHGKEGEPKTAAGTFRHIEISGQLYGILKSHLIALKTQALADGHELFDRVFPGERGAPLQVGNFRRRVWAKLPTKAGLKHRTPHDLRHTFATLHIEASASLVWIKEQLGHSSIQVTVDLYKQWLQPTNTERADRLDVQTDRKSN